MIKNGILVYWESRSFNGISLCINNSNSKLKNTFTGITLIGIDYYDNRKCKNIKEYIYRNDIKEII